MTITFFDHHFETSTPQSSSEYSSGTNTELDAWTPGVASMPPSPPYPLGVIAGQQQHSPARRFLPTADTLFASQQAYTHVNHENPHILPSASTISQQPKMTVECLDSLIASSHAWQQQEQQRQQATTATSRGSPQKNWTYASTIHTGNWKTEAAGGRTRTVVACEKCRQRKAKCTGGSPCERCSARGHTCKYPERKPYGPNLKVKRALDIRRHPGIAHPPGSASGSESRSSDGMSSEGSSPPGGEVDSLMSSQPSSPARYSQSRPSSAHVIHTPPPLPLEPSQLVRNRVARRRAVTSATSHGVRPVVNTPQTHIFYGEHPLDQQHRAYMQANMHNCITIPNDPIDAFVQRGMTQTQVFCALRSSTSHETDVLSSP
ncbi:uncharacterized protein BXZ73DRAFT_79589 [Epithele typhae]|uniref:uncharacterized protein n=1 Tax=Epithele typhae TaxID=378194 RepID=UPI0020084780|nr:uncharacterized protein BXZ73DRAFT_79589 [Epithele typhae]KAH9923182.1 hypothetical protein BXZ73DRAFT_79589 [Epithele typhae]